VGRYAAHHLAAAQNRRQGKARQGKARLFFSEEKKQKTFIFCAGG
jgi:hypothetical protein